MDLSEIILTIIALTAGLIALFLLSIKKKKSSQNTPESIADSSSFKENNLFFERYDWRIYSLENNGNIVNSVAIPHTHNSFTIGCSTNASFRIITGTQVHGMHAYIKNSSKKPLLIACDSSCQLYCKGKRVDKVPFKHSRVVWVGDSPVVIAKNHSPLSSKKCKTLLERDMLLNKRVF